jgi:aspartate racemase
MKKIGLVGGISWVSTIDYYKYINEGVNAKLGGLHAAECIVNSINYGDIQKVGWINAYHIILNACKSLEASNVDGIALCANTAHMFADKLQAEISIPFIHIGIETAKKITSNNLKKCALLGTKFTMELDFYREKLEKFGLEVIVPSNQETRDFIQQTIKEELGVGILNPDTKKRYIEIANQLIKEGAECLILGCTEIPMIISQNDFDVKVFDTTQIHSEAIVDFMTN